MSIDTKAIYKEKSYESFGIVIKFLNEYTPPNMLLTDSGKAYYYYTKYMDSDKSQYPPISPHYFLYIWMCSREPRPKYIDMKEYRMFSSDTMKIENTTYRQFTQMYADPIVYVDKLNQHYECTIVSDIYHIYPVSCRYILDRVITYDDDDYAILVEGNLATIKTRPSLMADDKDLLKNIKYAKESVTIKYKNTIIRSTHGSTIINSSDKTSHDRYVTFMSNITDSIGRDTTRSIHQKISLPSREINYRQILLWADTNKIPNSISSSGEYITLTKFVGGIDLEVCNHILESNRCYDNGDYEIYRLKGDKVLEFIVSSECSKSDLEQAILYLYNNVDKSISEEYIDPLTMNISNVSMLRSTNSIVFDSMYCRKAPPRVQPLIISKDKIEESLIKGKMVLIYDNLYYTTRDSNESAGQNFIGMINKFGDYDPNVAYVPIIRTYKKNHLVSKKFKELKSYLLRNSTDPCNGYISPDDILLPESMKYLYDIPISNIFTDIQQIHTKKTSITNNTKIYSSEVPDYIKSALDTNNVRRIVSGTHNTNLLRILSIDGSEFIKYVKSNIHIYDMIGVDLDKINHDISEDNLDHRLYGKLIEDYTNKSLIVFSKDGLVPYRFSKLEKSNYVLLYLTDNGSYDIILTVGDIVDDKLLALKNMINSSSTLHKYITNTFNHRRVDYTKVMIGLVSHFSTAIEEEGYNIVYDVVEEYKCKELVELTYSSCIYYNCYTRFEGYKYSHDLIYIRKNNCKIKTNTRWLCFKYSHMLSIDNNIVHIKSPIDMSNIHKWIVSIEDALYNSVGSYFTYIYEEIQQVVID